MRTVYMVDAHRVADDAGKAIGFGLKLSYWLLLFPLLAMVVYPIAFGIWGYGLIVTLVFAAFGRFDVAQAIAKNSTRQSLTVCRWLHRLGQFR